MASVTQKVPTYVLGMSTQPDEKKLPGQLSDIKNGVPDVIDQLVKRPGSQLVKDITTQSITYTDTDSNETTVTYAVNTGSHTKWFNIYTTDSEQYIGQVTNDGVVNIWRCSDGAPIPVDYSSIPGTNKATYLDNSALSNEKSSDIQALTINETTFFVNRRKDTAMLTDAIDKSHPQLYEAYIQIDTLAYGRQYALDFFDPDDNTLYETTRATAMAAEESLTKASNLTGSDNNGKCEGMAREVFNASINTDKFGTVPPNMNATGKSRIRFEVDARCQPVVDPSNVGTGSAGAQYNDSYQCFAKLQFGGEGWEEDDTIAWTNKKGLSGTVRITAVSPIKCRANRGAIRPKPTSSSAEEHISANLIVSDLKATIDAVQANASAANRIHCEIVGSGLYLWSETAFGVTTPEKALMSIITTSANTIDDLPTSCRHGYCVRVANSNEDVDDYYLRFNVENLNPDLIQKGTMSLSGTTVTVVTDSAHGYSSGDQIIFQSLTPSIKDEWATISVTNSTTFTFTHGTNNGTLSNIKCFIHPRRFGEGVWEEVCARGVTTTLNKDTMPLKLTRVLPGQQSINGGGTINYTNGTFKFEYPDWGERDAGDDVTNSEPSFVGHPIQNMVFFRNRITLLSEENVILSRVNQFYNFWVKTAMAISNGDPIDLQSSSTYPTRLHSAIEATGGLVVLSASEQFLVSSGQEALFTPETVKVTYLSSYAFNADTNPISLGTSIGFLNSTAKNARFYEMADVSNRAEPEVAEQTKIIGRLFPNDTTLVTGSTENDLLLFGVDSTLHTPSNTVWGYKWYQQGDQRAQSAWFRWTLPNNLTYHCILDDVYYTILQNSDKSKFTLEKFDVKLSDDTLLIDLPDDNTELLKNDSRIHLDTKQTIASGSITYNGSTDISTFNIGAGYYSSNTLTAYCIQSGNSAGKSYDIPAAKITGSAANPAVELPGNWKYENQEFAHSAVSTSAETITLLNHNITTGDSVVYKSPTTFTDQTADTAIGGLTNNTEYFVIVIDSSTIKLASSEANALAGTAINLTSQGNQTAAISSLQVLTDLVIGYEYEFQVQLPKIYVTKPEGNKIRSETRGSLVIHRMNFDFGSVGVIDVTLKRKGRDDYTYTVESLEWDNINSSAAAIAPEYRHTIPVYDRNTNLDVYIKSNHPSPTTLHSMNWEGDFSPRYYASV